MLFVKPKPCRQRVAQYLPKKITASLQRKFNTRKKVAWRSFSTTQSSNFRQKLEPNLSFCSLEKRTVILVWIAGVLSCFLTGNLLEFFDVLGDSTTFLCLICSRQASDSFFVGDFCWTFVDPINLCFKIQTNFS